MFSSSWKWHLKWKSSFSLFVYKIFHKIIKNFISERKLLKICQSTLTEFSSYSISFYKLIYLLFYTIHTIFPCIYIYHFFFFFIYLQVSIKCTFTISHFLRLVGFATQLELFCGSAYEFIYLLHTLISHALEENEERGKLKMFRVVILEDTECILWGFCAYMCVCMWVRRKKNLQQAASFFLIYT